MSSSQAHVYAKKLFSLAPSSLVREVGQVIMMYLASSFTQATMTPLRVLLLLILQPWLT